MPANDFRLVIIEDGPDEVDLLRRHLLEASERNYQFVVASNGEAGILACTEPGAPGPDCVILDYRLPDMDGLEVLERMNDDAGDVSFPIVLLTGANNETKAPAAALRARA